VSAPAGGARRGRPGHDLESILRTAVRLFTERGYDATSMEDLSRALGITKSAIYHHVPSKEELLRLATARALDGLFAAAAAVEAAGGRAIGRLERLVRDSVAVLVAELPFVTLLLRVHGNTAAEREALARRREFDQFTASLVKQAVADGDLRPDIDPVMTAKLLFGMVSSAAEWYRPERGASGGDLAEAICKLAFEGLRTLRRIDVGAPVGDYLDISGAGGVHVKRVRDRQRRGQRPPLFPLRVFELAAVHWMPGGMP
jgi:AcrR family transcriptional regulator